MPREHRKRGKKHRKNTEEEEYGNQTDNVAQSHLAPVDEGPSWIQPAQNNSAEFNGEAPFGYVDADVKAYFRTVDLQIRDWADAQEEAELETDNDPNEERRMFFIAALKEMEGKELQLATDPDCSVVLERMAYSMDDFIRRVFMDKLAGSYEQLLRHRFASHVCQTFFTLARDTISRETKGIFPAIPETSEGELRTLTELVLDASKEILPSLSDLLLDSFASHVIRALLILHTPNVSVTENRSNQALRSKKSMAWKAKQGKMQSVFVDSKKKGKENAPPAVPRMFRENARKFLNALRDGQGANEVRALAANQVASPALQILLEVEADLGLSAEKDSLMDRVTSGLITACLKTDKLIADASDYVNTLLRDPTSSHLLETIVSRIPDIASKTLWTTYFKGRLSRLSAHPVSNFVLAKAFERLSAEQLSEACVELGNSWTKTITTSRTGVLRASIDRAATLQACEREICDATYAAFDLHSSEDHSLLIPCILCLAPLEDYKNRVQSEGGRKKCRATAQPQHSQQHPPKSDQPAPTVQGALLLQSLLRLTYPYNDIVTSGIIALPIEKRIEIAYDPNGSRIYDALLDSPTVPPKAKRQFILDLIGHFHTLVDDRLGSRVGDKCWAYADTYLKEKIARSLFNHEQHLAASYYGKFFARHLNLHLLRRRADQWRDMQTQRKAELQAAKMPVKPESQQMTETPDPEKAKTKRKRKPTEDEIDALFDGSMGKKVKRAALDSHSRPEAPSSNSTIDNSGLENVMKAIRNAPGDLQAPRKKRN